MVNNCEKNWANYKKKFQRSKKKIAKKNKRNVEKCAKVHKKCTKMQKSAKRIFPCLHQLPPIRPTGAQKKNVTKSKCRHPLPTLWAHKKMQNAHNILHFFVLFSEMIQPFEKMISHCKGFGDGGAGPGTQGTHT